MHATVSIRLFWCLFPDTIYLTTYDIFPPTHDRFVSSSCEAKAIKQYVRLVQRRSGICWGIRAAYIRSVRWCNGLECRLSLFTNQMRAKAQHLHISVTCYNVIAAVSNTVDAASGFVV
jgi:hypothetical protein